MRRGSAAAAAVLAAVLAAPPGCGSGEEPARVSLEVREPVAYPPSSPGTDAEPLRFGVGAMLTPQEGFAHYSTVLKRVERTLEHPVRLVDRPTYAAVNEALERGEMDVAFVCSGPYVRGRRGFGLELVAVPVVNGTSTYRGLVIVRNDSPFRTVEDLRGARFAFTDPDSNTGHLVPRHLLAGLGETPETFFAETRFTGSHDKSILAVAGGMVDAAAVDGLIWRHARLEHPEEAEQTRVLWSSEPFGIPPVVARPGLDAGLKQRLREVFLGLHLEAGGREMLAGIGVERFVEGRDADYDSVRAMEAVLAAPGTGRGAGAAGRGGQP